jgi:hypothetical protein
MYHPEQLTKPKKLFTLTPGTLERIANLTPEDDDAHYSTRGYMPTGMYKALSPIMKGLCKYKGYTPTEIIYEIDARTIPQGWSHRGDDWHADTGTNSEIIVVSNCIPTKFLTGDAQDNRQPEREAILNLPGPIGNELTRFSDNAIEEAIKKGIFRIHQPKPNEVVAFSGYGVHQSPTNETGEDINRVFMRIGMYR